MSLGRDTIITCGTRLPPSLGVYRRLETLLTSADASQQEVVELVHIDPALTFQVIKLANSAMFGLRDRCESLEGAVARVGFSDIHRIVGVVVARKTFQSGLALYDIAAGRLWENAIAVAALGAEIAKVAGTDNRAAYTTGLLRGLGKVILNGYAGARRYPGAEAEPDVNVWEKREHGYAAPEVSALLMEHWRFSPESILAVRHHWHREPPPSGAAARLHLACGRAAAWGCALPGESAWRSDDELLAAAGVRREQLEQIEQAARVQFAGFAQIEWSLAA